MPHDTFAVLLQMQQQMTQILACREEEHVPRITTLLEDKKKSQAQIQSLQQALCRCMAKEIVTEWSNDNTVLVKSLEEASNMDLSLLATAIWELQDNQTEGRLLLLLSGCSFLLSGDPTLVDPVGKPMAVLLNARGGGKKGKFQCNGKQIPTSESLQTVEQLLRQTASEKK